MPDLDPQPPAPAGPAGEPAAATATPTARRSLDYDPLASLKKMSTTAGVGAQDYVAINPVAIAAILLGVGSLLAVFADVLMVIPVAGVVCAIVAMRQVRNSNGTQTGAALAVAGLALSVLIGGGVLGKKSLDAWNRRADEQAIAALIGQLGQHVSADRYAEAYQLFSERFRARVKPEAFTERFEETARLAPTGKVRSMRWNDTTILFDQDAGTGTQFAKAMALIAYEKPIEPAPRGELIFSKVGGRWVIEDFPDLFPPERKPRGR